MLQPCRISWRSQLTKPLSGKVTSSRSSSSDCIGVTSWCWLIGRFVDRGPGAGPLPMGAVSAPGAGVPELTGHAGA